MQWHELSPRDGFSQGLRDKVLLICSTSIFFPLKLSVNPCNDL